MAWYRHSPFISAVAHKAKHCYFNLMVWLLPVYSHTNTLSVSQHCIQMTEIYDEHQIRKSLQRLFAHGYEHSEQNSISKRTHLFSMIGKENGRNNHLDDTQTTEKNVTV